MYVWVFLVGLPLLNRPRLLPFEGLVERDLRPLITKVYQDYRPTKSMRPTAVRTHVDFKQYIYDFFIISESLCVTRSPQVEIKFSNFPKRFFWSDDKIKQF